MITLYSVMMVPPIFKWNNIPLIVFMAILYALFIPIAYDYMFLSCQDPVDRRVYEDLGDETDTKLCSKCQRRVSKQTYHCLRCDRCTFKLDHHSHLVNNCVSLENFRNYIRMTFCFNLLTLNMTVQCLVIFFFSLSD